jgi:integrase
MAVNLICSKCKKTYKLGTRICQSCGLTLRNYKVRVHLEDGRWKSKQVKSLTLARSVEAQFQTDKIKGETLGVRKAPKLSLVWSDYIKWAKANKRTWKADLSRWNHHIEPVIGSLKMNRISPKHVQKILNRMIDTGSSKGSHQGSGYAPATLKQVLILVKRLFNYAKDQKLYKGDNPGDSVELEVHDNTVTRPLAHDEMVKLLDTLNTDQNDRAVLIVQFGLATGRRKGEILGLKWQDVDLINGLVTFPGYITKNKKTQSIPIGEEAVAVLGRAKVLQVSELVFPCQTGKFYHSFTRTWHRIRKRAGLNDFRFHDLRHSYATFLASSGKVDIYTLQNLLGHKDRKMTERYAHLIDSTLRLGTSVIDRIMRQ